MNRQRLILRGAVYLPLVGIMFATGCASPTTREDAKLANFFSTPEWLGKAPWSKKDDEPPKPYPNPAKLAATWSPDVLMQTGKTPTRGFGGRLFFFDERSKTVPVEGTLTVHGFEVGADGKDQQIKPFRFTPEQFTRHFTQSDFGASYSIWIPWDAVGGKEKRISLVASFQPTEGKIIQGSPTTMILPGEANEANVASPSDMYSKTYQSHQDAVVHHATRPSGLVTTTIKRHRADEAGSRALVGKSLQERLAATTKSAATTGKTPFVDIQSSSPGAALATQTRTIDRSVRPVSAVMPTQERDDRTMPRRATMTTGATPQRIGTKR
ncbi:MAG: hypothetical protein AAF802_18370 [Planctomycetota bacterium]